MEITILATIGLGIVAKIVERKLEKAMTHEWDSLEVLNQEVQKQKVYSGLESYS